jgi:predicted dehydrogenase
MSTTVPPDVNWGLLGAGWLAQAATAEAIHHAQGARLQSAGARDLLRAERTGATNCYDNYQSVIDDASVDAIYICLSNEAHLPWIRAGIAAGKHVLCEKPLVLAEDEAASVFADAADAGVILVEAVWSRWHPRMRRIVELARTGALGEITGFMGAFTFDEVAADNYRLRAERGGGALYDVGIYPLHALFGLLDSVDDLDIVSVDRTRPDGGVDLTTRASLAWGENTSATITGSFVMPESQLLHVLGTQSELRITDNEAFTSYKKATDLWVDDHRETFPATNAYQIMFEEISARIRGEEGWILPSRDSLRVARAVDMIRTTPSAGDAHAGR